MFTPAPLLNAKIALTIGVLVASTLTASADNDHRIATSTTTFTAEAPATRPTLEIIIKLTATESDAPAIDTAASTLGVADSNIYQLSQAGVVQDLDELQSMGVTTIRTLVPWMDIEPTQGTYNWTQMDYIVQQAADRGISIVATVSENPSWDGTYGIGAPNPTAYAAFAAAVASRYSSQISAIEVMNEENSQGFNLGGSAATYTAVLKAAYTAIKAVNPNITVIVGGLASVATNSIGTSPETFLSQMLADGAAGFFDAVAYHPYNFGTQFSQGADMAESALNQLTALRADLNAYGLNGIQLWATEYGEPTTPGVATPTQQAAFIENFVIQWNALAKTLNLGPAYLYTTRDISSGQNDDEDNYGLFYTNGTPKPAAVIVQELEYDLQHGLPLPSLASTLISITPGQQVAFAITELSEWMSLPIKAIQFGVSELAAGVASLPPIKLALAAAAAVFSLPPVKAAVSAVLKTVGAVQDKVEGAVTAAAITTVINTVNSMVSTGETIGPAVAAAVKSLNTNVHNTQLTLAAAMKGTQTTMAAIGAAVAAALNPSPKTPAKTVPTTATKTPAAKAITAVPATAVHAASSVTVSTTATAASVTPRKQKAKKKDTTSTAAATTASTHTAKHRRGAHGSPSSHGHGK